MEEKYIAQVSEVVRNKYGDIKEVYVNFDHDRNGGGPYIAFFKVVTRIGKEIEDYDLADELYVILDEVRVNIVGRYSFIIDLEENEIY